VIIDRLRFGTLPDGRDVHLFRLRLPTDVTIEVLELGAIVRSLRVPDRSGLVGDVVLGYDDLEGYASDPWFIGGVVGRYAGRIRAGRFRLDGHEYALDANDGPHHLHGGARGFHRRLWDVEPFASPAGVGVDLRLTDDEQGGYPGRLDVHVSYTLTSANEWIVEYEAEADEATVLNLTQHSYFNLSGGTGADVLGHRLLVHADAFAATDATFVPNGDLLHVADTPLDFRNAAAVGSRIDGPSLMQARGYDHDLVLRRPGDGLVPAARVLEPRSGRTLEIHTTEPALHVYSGNVLDGSRFGKGGRRLGRRQGLCLETQHLPDSPNHPQFPTTVLRPGETFRSRTVYAFGTDR
jgi:aldose 1-epimerase